MSPLLPLRARHCLITGAYGGIGAAIASRFAAEGALVTLLGRKEDKLREVCAQLSSFRDTRLSPLSAASANTRPTTPGSDDEAVPAHSYAVMDLSADGRDEAILDHIWKRTGQIDVLVNAAGIAQFQLLQNTSLQAARELVDTNLMGTIFMSRYMAQRMKRRRADRDAMSREPLEKRIPLGRLGRPEEVADAAVFLAQNTYANNCVLNLDGGLSAA
ncbi:3-oxoacyl-[acyl-carrier-protein] reductase FabG [Colletotrichum trifolii]|uniref:3-oxoacyl-[acyl-carrier-protein] reductase FabG n=1 Tax=Colletotrichum trifolii TaxID=5466 RepID=A0A4V3HWU8_COLTR|nr:3-oxoacyl-[acyl-carrier-protein] reductase FabG [Colletotrichum trifolii]